MQHNFSVPRRKRRASCSLFVLSSAFFLLWAISGDEPAYSATDLLTQKQQLTASDKTVGDAAQFGTSVAISGATALVGAPGNDAAGSSSGAAYVFARNTEGQWTQSQILTPSDGAAGKLFGNSVALSDNTALIGARGDTRGDSTDKKNFAGAVYVFTRDATTNQWNQLQKLIASDATTGDLFGYSVALLGDIALIGARGSENRNTGSPGAAYIFTQDTNGQWNQTWKLLAADGVAGDGFGFSVALSDDLAVVGARNKAGASGAAYTFTQGTGGQWSQLQKLTAGDGAAGDEFGYSVAVSEGTIVVGAPFAAHETDGTTIFAGAVYVFASGPGPIGTRGNELQKLTSSDGATGDEFGVSVALTSDTILVGSPNSSSAGAGSGAAYQFSFTQDPQGPGQWTQTLKIAARDARSGDEFGSSIALSSDTALVGTPFDDIVVTDDKGNTTTYTDTGSVYVLVPAFLPDACTSKTDYADAGCSGTFSANSLTDLDKYVTNDFGRAGQSKYQNLALSGTLSATILAIESPCQITLASGTTLSGDFVTLDGRNGVIGTNGFQLISATNTACILSEQDRTELGASSIVIAGRLTLKAAKTAKISGNTTLNVDGDLIIESTGDSSASMATVDTGSVVTAGSIKLEAQRNAQLGQDTTVTATNTLALISIGTSSNSQAGVQSDAQVKATNLVISSPRGAAIGKNTTVALSGDLTLTATDNSSGSEAIVDDGARVAVAGKAEITSGNKASINKNATVIVSHNLNMEAGKCSISGSATVKAGSKSGNCL